MTEKRLLKSKIVVGNIRDYTQRIEIYYYPRDSIHSDKIVVYFLLENGSKNYAKRSIYFNTISDLREFIYQLAYAYGFIRHKRDVDAFRDEEEVKRLLKNIYNELIKGYEDA